MPSGVNNYNGFGTALVRTTCDIVTLIKNFVLYIPKAMSLIVGSVCDQYFAKGDLKC